MHLDKFVQTHAVVGQAKELILDGEPLQAICRLAARYPMAAYSDDPILAAACRDIADYYADQTLNPETDR